MKEEKKKIWKKNEKKLTFEKKNFFFVKRNFVYPQYNYPWNNKIKETKENEMENVNFVKFLSVFILSFFS